MADLRPGDAGFTETVARLLAMPLDRYAHEGSPLEIEVPGLEETLWFVPDERQSNALVREGVRRGRIWTAEELLRIVPVASHDVVRTISVAKVAVDGDVVDVRRRQSWSGPTVRQETSQAAGGTRLSSTTESTS